MGESMVIRVAAAINAAMDEDFPAFTRQSWEQLSGPAKNAMIRRALAAIKAMREPSISMVHDGVMTMTMPWGDVISPSEDADKYLVGIMWSSMIDAALEPHPQEERG